MAVCRASSAFSLFFLRAQCPLKLTSSSSLSIRRPKNNYTWTTIDHNDRCPFAHACSSNTYVNVRFGTYLPLIRDRDRDTKFEKSKNKTRNKWHAPFVPISLSIFQIGFPETGWTHERGTRDQRLCQPARPYLLTIKHIRTRKYATYPNQSPYI